MDSAWQDLVIENLKEIKAGQTKMQEDFTAIKVEQATMKAEIRRDARWISGIGSAIAIGLSTGIHLVFKK